MYTNVLLICASVFLVPGACRGYQRASDVFRRSYGEWEAAELVMETEPGSSTSTGSVLKGSAISLPSIFCF